MNVLTEYVFVHVMKQEQISSILSPIALAHFEKKNVRSLNKAQVDQLEHLKLCILSGMTPFMEIDEQIVKDLLDSYKNPSTEFAALASEKIAHFKKQSERSPVSNELK